MRLLQNPLTKVELLSGAENVLDDVMIKAVVDIERELVAVDAQLHADLEKLLLEQGSAQESLWGINFWCDDEGEDFIEFDSMINVRPRQGNRSRYVEDEATRAKITEIVNKWIK